MDPRDGKMAGTLIPVAIFTQVPRIVADANPRLEEPDAVIPHVRVCGGPGSQRPGPTRRGWTATCRSHSSKGTLGHRAPASRSEPIDYLVGHGDKGATEPAGSGFRGVWCLRSSVLSGAPGNGQSSRMKGACHVNCSFDMKPTERRVGLIGAIRATKPPKAKVRAVTQVNPIRPRYTNAGGQSSGVAKACHRW